jgi:diguanylate cyclase (GGDEF)-like protein
MLMWLWLGFGCLLVLLAAGLMRCRVRCKRLEQLVVEANQRIGHVTADGSGERFALQHRFEEVMPQEWRRAIREQTPFVVLVIDVDHFKEYVDAVGYREGEQFLVQVRSLIQKRSRRGGDFVFPVRNGRFRVILRTPDCRQAFMLAESIRAECEALAIPHPASSAAPVATLSIGLICARSSLVSGRESAVVNDWESLYRRADALLFAAKQQGRNRVVSEEWTPGREQH